jgi:DNA polymerase III alpha subunit (gram-positive type)|tara:strand:- start:128 stop:1411 length:1284 start_codon:yes stop_codon:yes gene_type:complete
MALFRGTGGSGDASTDTYASEVALEATRASTKANEAAASATSAATAQAAAEAAKTAAQTAQTNAETAETNAETAETNAETAENAAVAAQGSATTAKTAAETAQSAAEVAKTAAETAETNAETAETNAAASATTATTKATEAATSATSAASSASSASTSATNAATSATAAQTAQTAAETAKTAAEAAKEAIDGLYLGTASSNPTVDGNGNAVTVGDWYFNTSDNTTRIYDGSNWNTINPDLVGDTTPQLGGNLDLNSRDITGTGNVNITGNVVLSGTVDGRDVAADGTKLDGIEASATADQTAAEIRTLVESASDSNVFTDADHTKLNGIEASADVTDTANVTAAGALMDSEVTNLAQVKAFSSADYATAAQGALADSALQSGDNISVLTNNSGYLTANQTITLSGAVTGSGTTSITTTLSTVDGGTY